MKKSNFRNLCNNYSVCKNGKYAAILPVVIVLVAVIMIVALGTRPGSSYSDAVGIGIDFEGGTILTVTLGQDAKDNYDTNRDAIVKAIQDVEYKGVSVVVSYSQLQEANDVSKTAIVFRYKNVLDNDADIAAMNDAIRDAVDKNAFPDINLADKITYQSIGATAASDLLSKAGIALAVSLALILIYIMIRFTLMSAFAAIIALIHDIVIMFALTVICRVQINSSYVAAMITIVAYSINNTIIIFDRCREMIKPLKGQKNIDYKGIGDQAVRASLTRTIFSTLTTMVTVVFLAILGSESIREFCVPIILGLMAGLYSALTIATPLWAAMSISFDKTKEKYAKRHNISYDKKDDEEVDATVVKGDDEAKPVQVKQAGAQKQKANTVYKYSKKNTTFKKKK
ncbi:MAG TPA: protein translocase subunit SecF [Ruminococcaceae bacterium]|nr:protein translocase subunit SecF [Oscillospiraceae bacterium]